MFYKVHSARKFIQIGFIGLKRVNESWRKDHSLTCYILIDKHNHAITRAIPAFLASFSWGKRIRHAGGDKFLKSLLHSGGTIRAAITCVSVYGTFLASTFLPLHLHLHIPSLITATTLCKSAN